MSDNFPPFDELDCEHGDDFDGSDPDDDTEPIGSCESCGQDIYESGYGSDIELCDECAWDLEEADELGGEG